MSEKQKPVVLIIRDGWGANHDASYDAYNAVKLANTPVADRLSAEYPRTEIAACGLEVGLPAGIMGNSEVGHQNIGAGRVVDQELPYLLQFLQQQVMRQYQFLLPFLPLEIPY